MIASLYNRILRPHLPAKIICKNGIPSPTGKLLDQTNEIPNYEEALLGSIREHVSVGDSSVLVGGGLGISSVVTIHQTHSDVSTFEASAECCEIIRETARLNKVSDNSTVTHALVETGDEFWGDLGDPDIIEASDLPESDTLILDCEGAETDILRNLPHTPSTIIVETHGVFGSPTEETVDILEENDYTVIDRRDEVPENDVRVITAVR